MSNKRPTKEQVEHWKVKYYPHNVEIYHRLIDAGVTEKDALDFCDDHEKHAIQFLEASPIEEKKLEPAMEALRKRFIFLCVCSKKTHKAIMGEFIRQASKSFAIDMRDDRIHSDLAENLMLGIDDGAKGVFQFLIEEEQHKAKPCKPRKRKNRQNRITKVPVRNYQHKIACRQHRNQKR